MLSHIETLTSNLGEITDSIQVSTGKYFVVIVLANIFWSVPIATGCKLHFAFTIEETHL